MGLQEINLNIKIISYNKLIYILIILITILKAFRSQEENKQSHQQENPKEKFSDFNIISIDGLLVEVDYKNFFKIMKKMDYAIVYIYNPKICRIGMECKEILEEFKKASEKLYKHKPAIGLFKIRCNFVPENLNTVKKDNFCEHVNMTEENIPQLMFIYHGNYVFLDKYKPIFHSDIIKEMENKIFLSTVSSLSHKKDIKNLFTLEEKIQEKIESYPLKFIFYSNKIDSEKIPIEEYKNSTYDLSRLERNSTYLESLFLNSYLITIFKAYKITNKRSLIYFIKYVENNSNYVINEIEKFTNNLEEYLDKPENENLLITFDVPEQSLNDQDYKEKPKEINLRKINILSINLQLLEKNYTQLSEQVSKSLYNSDLKNLQDLIIFNTFSNLVNYITNTEATKLIKYTNAKGYLFFVASKNKPEIFREYVLIAKKFEYLKEKIWFLYSNEEEQSDLEDKKDSNNIKLFYYDDYDSIGKPTYFFSDEDINFNYILNFVNKKTNFDNLTKISDSKNKLLDIFEYKSEIVSTKHFILFFYNLGRNEENKSMFKKWIYLLERANYLINEENYTKIQFFKYDFSNNKELINFPTNLNANSTSKIYLYTKKSGKNEIYYEYKQYENGPSLQFFENFLKENLPLIKIQFPPEENQNYFEEIFYNNELMELQSELDEIEDEFGFNPKEEPKSEVIVNHDSNKEIMEEQNNKQKNDL